MSKNLRIAAACLALAAVTPAAAADPITVPISSLAELPISDTDANGWDGFYAGIYSGVQDSTAGGTQFGIGVNAGVEVQFDFYLIGTEVAVQGLSDDGAGETVYGQILGRAGLVVSDDVAVYAAGGYGIDLGPPDEQDILAGGGIELSLTDSVSVRAQYLRSFPTVGDNPKNQFTVGATYSF
ncbi:outer membrane protein [Devosia chinhatensis]|uniref:Outer membrane protein beta-barrel domain-containing protein n=1 Tax=Devosia chinhatensis TaxID=429727 RepID=A0A0F5FM34_9HYPH|nr:hypothetical protein [Devosia chinhatensis]KKB09600.1 hypothetical protein VE26_06840 [Devosia chinhatensis]